MKLASFKDLIVWQRAIELAQNLYKVTSALPAKESFGLQSQMRRASVSIASNIAEGKRRGTSKEFLQFLRIADGSAAELETQIIIAESVYPELDVKKSKLLLEEVQKMLSVMMKKIRINL
ncbi:MAG: four helix bundle protein [Patescibacteria group bacterium]